MPAYDPIGDFLRSMGKGRPKTDDPTETPQEPPPEQPEEREPVDVNIDWLDVSDDERNDIQSKLEEAHPANEQQALWWMGWMGNVSPDVRKAAREAYNEQYGEMTSDEWERWRDEVGSPPFGEAA